MTPSLSGERLSSWLALFLFCSFLGTARAQGGAPPEKLPEAPAMPAESERFLQGKLDKLRHDPGDLGEMTRQILPEERLSPEQKVYCFYMAQNKVSAAFNGAMPLYPGKNYFETFDIRRRFHQEIARRLAYLDLSADPFVRVARERFEDNAILSSHALTLAAMLDSAKARPVILEQLAPAKLAKAHAAPVAIHYLALAATFSMDSEMAAALNGALQATSSEESKEDLLCAMLATSEPAGVRYAMAFLRATDKADNALETAFFGVLIHMPPDELNRFANELAARASDPGKAARVRAMNAREIERCYSMVANAPPGRTVFKVWDWEGAPPASPTPWGLMIQNAAGDFRVYVRS